MVATNYAAKANKALAEVERIIEGGYEDANEAALVYATVAVAYATLAVSTTMGGPR